MSAMLPSSSIRVLEQAGWKLEVVCPPFYLAAVASFVMAIIGATAMFFILGGDRNKWTSLILLGSQLPFLLISFGLATTGARAVLDGSTGTVTIHRRIFAIPAPERTFPITSVKLVFIEAGKGTGRLVFVLKDGSAVPVGFLTNQPGNRGAVDAINKFLDDYSGSKSPNVFPRR